MADRTYNWSPLLHYTTANETRSNTRCKVTRTKRTEEKATIDKRFQQIFGILKGDRRMGWILARRVGKATTKSLKGRNQNK